MKKEKMDSTEAASLREKAEEQLKKKRSVRAKPLAANYESSEANSAKILHELEVYQIELEMQNEELRMARDKAETATEKYTAIYDYAYTGFFTLNSDGIISELNQSGAKMLGRDRSSLVNSNFKQYVTIDTRSEFNDFFRKVFETDSKLTCEVRLIVKGSPSIFAHIEGIISGDEEKCLVTVVDITKRRQAEGILKLKAHEFELFNELMSTNDQQMMELKKEINYLLQKLGEKEKFIIEE